MHIHVVEDSPCHLETQLELVRILESLYTSEGVRLLLVEAGTGDVSLAYLRSFGPPANRRDVAGKYLRLGVLSGEEYLDIVSEWPLILWGVEDKELYKSATSRYLADLGVVTADPEPAASPTFFDVSRRRANVIVKNSIAKMKEIGENKAALIANFSLVPLIVDDLRQTGASASIHRATKGHAPRSLVKAIFAYKNGYATIDCLYERPLEQQAPVLEVIGPELSERLMQWLQRHPQDIRTLDPHLFEQVVAEILAERHFDIDLNVRTVAGEVDIVAFSADRLGTRVGYVIECKRYRAERVRLSAVVRLLGIKEELSRALGLDRALFVTTADFTQDARRLEQSRWDLSLRNYEAVAEWLHQYHASSGLYLPLRSRPRG